MRLVLAPMEGVVDFVMRDLLTQIGGIDACTTEFVRVTHTLLPKATFFRFCPELKTSGRTRAGVQVSLQLLGGQPQVMAENAAFAVELGAPVIDLNFGCPAKTVNRHDGGAVILKDPKRVFAITEAVRKSVPVNTPVSVKIRLGFETADLALENAMAAQSAGASWLTVHARTKVDGYRPPAYWDWIAKIRQNLSIPVIANGEIWTQDDFNRCQQVTGCNEFMLGRGLIANPFLACHLRDANESIAWERLAPWLVYFFEQSAAHESQPYAISRIKQWVRLLSRNHACASDLFAKIKSLHDFQAIAQILRTTHH